MLENRETNTNNSNSNVNNTNSIRIESVSGNPFEIKLDFFDGPIDLLLHLVKKNELEIEKLSLVQVANQYLECLEAMKRIDLDVAGEYLVMATTLLAIKASFLLHEPIELEVNDDGDLVDPSEELLKRLKEAQIYKEGARELSKAKILGFDVFARPSSLKNYESTEIQLKDEDATLLAVAFGKVLKGLKNRGDYVVEVDNVSIVERMMNILDKIKESGNKIKFSDLSKDFKSVVDVVGSFCALLELCRRHILKVFQEDTFQDIVISLDDLEFDADKFKKEYKRETELEFAI